MIYILRMSLSHCLSPLVLYQTSSDLLSHGMHLYEAPMVEPVWRRNNREGKSLIRAPLPQKDPRQRPMIAMTTTEHAAGTA